MSVFVKLLFLYIINSNTGKSRKHNAAMHAILAIQTAISTLFDNLRYNSYFKTKLSLKPVAFVLFQDFTA